jgi:prevent-host-death family protein
VPVGIRELKAHLSDYVGRAARGEDIVVTDRGRPVVRVVPYVAASEIERGIEEGWIEPPRRTKLEPFERMPSALSTLEVLEEDRGE